MRIDDFYSAVKYKVRWVIQQANIQKARAITLSGDVFDTTHTSFEVMVDIHRILSRFRGEILAIYGQHDLRYHSYKARKNTPLSALLATIKNQMPVCERNVTLTEDGVKVTVFGASWGQELTPAPDVDGFKVLLLHRLVVEDGGLWQGHTDFTSAAELFALGYDLIVSGDNHQSFSVEHNGRWVINVGSLVRLKINQAEYKPRIAVTTFTDKISVEWISVPIHDAVFNEEQAIASIGVSEELLDFITSLQEHRFQKPDFERNLQGAVSNVTETAIKDMVDEVMDRIRQQQEAA
jgi:DNA repair exonuclease SbcCD nuclease subunit